MCPFVRVGVVSCSWTSSHLARLSFATHARVPQFLNPVHGATNTSPPPVSSNQCTMMYGGSKQSLLERFHGSSNPPARKPDHSISAALGSRPVGRLFGGQHARKRRGRPARTGRASCSHQWPRAWRTNARAQPDALTALLKLVGLRSKCRLSACDKGTTMSLRLLEYLRSCAIYFSSSSSTSPSSPSSTLSS